MLMLSTHQAAPQTFHPGPRRLVAALFYPLPFVGAFGDPIAGKLVSGKAGQVSIRNAPAAAMVEDLARSVLHAYDRATANGADPDLMEAFLHGLELAVGLKMGAPVRQVQKTATGAKKIWTGERPDFIDAPFQATGDVLFGPPTDARPDQSNFLGDIQKIVDGG